MLTISLGAGGAAALSKSVERDPPGPLRVTTDTPEYCDSLAGEVTAHPQAAADVVALAEEGRRMCASGLVRGGVLRVRRALLMLRGDG